MQLDRFARYYFISFVFLFFLLPDFSAQPSYIKKFRNISRPEKRWILFHPFCAIKVKKHTRKALSVVDEVKKTNILDQYGNGGKLDAFRHVFTMAYLAQRIKVKKLRKLGIAHEKGNRLQFEKGKFEEGELPDSVSCEMDLRNNEIGFNIGVKNKDLNIDSLKSAVISFVESEGVWIIQRNEKGNYITCAGNELILEEWKRRWDIPKCLRKKFE